MAELPRSIAEASRLLRGKRLSAPELLALCERARDAREQEVRAFLEVFDDAKAQAAEAQQRLDRGEGGELTGIPIAVKDNILQSGRRASAGSKILEPSVAPYDATATAKLKAAGAVLVGRTNMDEFAMGSSTEHSAYGVTRNPHDAARVPGGSSGGSAAAVAMGAALGALGSDTGGSIRQPASFCGIVGLKPTYGSVSRHGLIAMGSSLDVIGPLSRTVEDARLLFNMIRGRDPYDATSHDGAASGSGVKRVGVPRAFLEAGLEPDVRAAFDAALARLKAAGLEVIDIELKHVPLSLPAYYIIMPAEASTNLARFDGVKYGLHVESDTLLNDYLNTRAEGFGPEVRRRILLGTYVLSAGYYEAFYGKAQAARALITDDFARAFKEVDVIATPTTPTPAFRIGEKSDPLAMYLEDIFTVPANIAGIPALSVPMGTIARDGVDLPVGLQLLAPHNGEELLFAAGTHLGS